MDGHPSYHSHHVNCLQEINEYVPNFIGGSLPQSDQGDRDYYFNTMHSSSHGSMGMILEEMMKHGKMHSTDFTPIHISRN